MDHLEVLAGDGVSSKSKSKAENNEHEDDGEEKRKDCVDAWFTDLFVRCNNYRAMEMYEKLGYSVYRRVVE
jgi:N-terminal acetyltransferase B complex catalytic subunit